MRVTSSQSGCCCCCCRGGFDFAALPTLDRCAVLLSVEHLGCFADFGAVVDVSASKFRWRKRFRIMFRFLNP